MNAPLLQLRGIGKAFPGVRALPSGVNPATWMLEVMGEVKEAEAPAGAIAAAGAPSLRVVAAHVLNVSWSADHRVVDGATLARFSNAFKGLVESPLQLLL